MSVKLKGDMLALQRLLEVELVVKVFLGVNARSWILPGSLSP
jgi:hypothetical protein